MATCDVSKVPASRCDDERNRVDRSESNRRRDAFVDTIECDEFKPLDGTKSSKSVELSKSTTNETSSSNDKKQKQVVKNWVFEKKEAVCYARAFHRGCVKDHGVKKTVKKLRKQFPLDGPNNADMKILHNYFDKAVEKKDPTYLVTAYTVEGPFYQQMNKFMAVGSSQKVYEKARRKWSGYLTGLFMKNPVFYPYRFVGETYRGIKTTLPVFEKYQPNALITNKSFQSSSRSPHVPQNFIVQSKPDPSIISVLFIYKITDGRYALRIEEFSEHPEEEEVLILPGALFIVTHVATKQVPYMVHLQQYNWGDQM